MLMSFNEYFLSNVDATNKLPSWAKLEKYYNCEDFVHSIHNIPKKIKKNKTK